MMENQHIDDLRIDPRVHPGAVSLTVTDVENQLAFYRSAIGLQVHWRADHTVGLGAGGPDLLLLSEERAASRARGTTGLYHFALLYPDRHALAVVIARLLQQRWPNYPTDHIMTKSTYLEDAEGNGIELYCESPEDGSWDMGNGSFGAVRADGSWSDGREALDLQALFAHLEPGEGLNKPAPSSLRMGHVHLHVSSLDRALDFYHGLLGFDVMGIARQVGAAFVSAGGYHHHIGLNTWQGEGAPPPPAGAAGLRYFTLVLPDASDLDRMAARLDTAGIALTRNENGLQLQDPSSNGILLRTA